ncbi:MAG: hypothetical protein IM533_11250 [Pseudanabaena sp. M007S1SP1A06QC]|jgi:hypothetical protein|nr:hypothetical protein [Pseudanabaena sp. M007S1SP1A06QC]
MPESDNHQTSFTSSTYTTIFTNKPLAPISDLPLVDQPDIQSFLNASSDSPIPEVLLYRLLTFAEIYLEQKFPEKQLSGLCIGYILQSGRQSEFYYVSWGWISAYDDWIKAEKDKIGIKSTSSGERTSGLNEIPSNKLDTSEQSVLTENVELEKLAELIEEELNRRIKDVLIEDQHIKAFLLGHFSPAQRSSENLFQDSFDTPPKQFTFPLQSSTNIQFDADDNAKISLNRDIEVSPNIHFSITREKFDFAIRSDNFRAAASHRHNDGNLYKYTASMRHQDCRRV